MLTRKLCLPEEPLYIVTYSVDWWTAYPENIILHEMLPWGSASPDCHEATMSSKGQRRQSQWRTGVQNHQRGTQMHICRNGTLGVVLLPHQCLLVQAWGPNSTGKSVTSIMLSLFQLVCLCAHSQHRYSCHLYTSE